MKWANRTAQSFSPGLASDNTALKGRPKLSNHFAVTEVITFDR
jgi:hypothetical protein